MKYLITLVVLTACMTVYGQHMPDNKSFGLKASYNLSFPSFVANSSETYLSSTTNPSFGAGFYFRYDFNDHVSFQPELLISSRSGSVRSESETISESSPSIAITRTSVSNLSQVTAEFPLYLKMRWELTALHKGHYKANKAIGFVVGPRILLNMATKNETVSSEITRLYNQESVVFEDNSGTSDYFSPVTAGINVGADFELLNRLVLYANFYRGFVSMNKREQGFRSFDNRVEVGVGIRLY